MEKQTKKSFLLTATEVELMTMPLEAILSEVAEHFNDLHDAASKGDIKAKVATELDKRMGHASILFDEGCRLAFSHPDMGKQLIAASIYWQEQRGLAYLTDTERDKMMARVAEIEKEKEEKRKRQLRGLA